MFQILQ